MSHTLSYKEIVNLSPGRILNTLIEEYVLDEYSTRWSNEKQKEVPCHWFEEHPRSCAEDDGGYCTADGLPNYSGDDSRALSIVESTKLKGKQLKTITDVSCSSGFHDPVTTHWATFSDKPFEIDQRHAECNQKWASGETMALAVCRAALLMV